MQTKCRKSRSAPFRQHQQQVDQEISRRCHHPSPRRNHISTQRHQYSNTVVLFMCTSKQKSDSELCFAAVHWNKQVDPENNTLYWKPGHSSIQDVDTLHSNIEGAIKGLERFSPLSLIRRLTKLIPAGKEMYVWMLKSDDFKDYKSLAHCGQYDKVGYASVSELTYSASDVRTLRVRWCMSKSETQSFTVLKPVYLRGKTLRPLAQPKQLPEHSELKKKKLMISALCLSIWMGQIKSIWKTLSKTLQKVLLSKMSSKYKSFEQ